MDLSEYISQTISEVLKGVQTAALAAKQHGGAVNPSASGVDFPGAEPHVINDLVLLDFDVAVVVREVSGAEGGAKLAVWGVGAGASKHQGHESEHSNRLHFTIPIQLPVADKIGRFTRVAKR